MTKREKMVNRIHSYFATELTSDIYWKLFIFANFSHYTQKASPKKIKLALHKEYERILTDKENFFNRFTKISEETLKTSLESFSGRSNNRINNVLKPKHPQDHKRIIDLIPQTTFTNWIKTLYPTPYQMGILRESWSYDTLNIMQHFFFGTTYKDLKISTPKTDLFDFCFSNPNTRYFYFFNVVRCYTVGEFDKVSPLARQWDLTLYSALFIDGQSKPLNDKYRSIAEQNGRNIPFIDFYGSFIDNINPLCNGYDFCHSPYIVLCHIPREAKRGTTTPYLSSTLFDLWVDKPIVVPFPIYIFESYDELLEKSDKYINFPSLLKNLNDYYRDFTSKKYDNIRFENRRDLASIIHDLRVKKY